MPAERVAEGRFRLTGSPGLAQGAAAGDVVELREDGTFEVIERGGNLAVQVLADEFDPAALAELEAALRELGGWLDGGHTKLRVFTVPVAAAGFPAVEEALEAFLTRNADAEWHFGNVYDEDGETTLDWWN